MQAHNPGRKMEHSYAAPPPAAGVETFAGAGQPPFSINTSLAPRIIAPCAPAMTTGAQPVYHVRATITPVHRIDKDKPLQYEVRSGKMNEFNETADYTLSEGGEVLTHVRPEIRDGKTTMTIKPQFTDPLKDGVICEDGEVMRSGAQVHVYDGSQRVDPRVALNHLLTSGGREPRFPAAQAAARRDSTYSSRTIPRHRVPAQGTVRQDALRAKHQESERELMALHRRSESGIAAAKKRLSYQSGGESSEPIVPPVDAVPLDHGYSRFIPSLVCPTDDEKPRAYNWIIPTGEIDEDGIREAAELGKKGGFFDKVVNKFKAGNRSSGEMQLPMEFQGSDQLAHFLEDPTLGMHWEEEGFEGEDVIRPSIVYGGIEHCSPEFAGRLPPLTYLVSVIELHQYLAMSASDHPWFLQNKMDPNKHALFGPVPLPFDPQFSGMPAPTFHSMTRHGQPTPELCPQVQAFFNLELPCNYEGQVQVDDGTQEQHFNQDIAVQNIDQQEEEDEEEDQNPSSTSEEEEDDEEQQQQQQPSPSFQPKGSSSSGPESPGGDIDSPKKSDD